MVNTPSSSRNTTLLPRRLTQMTSGQTSSGTSHQSVAEITSQQSFPTQPADPALTNLLATIGNVEAMLASWESESRDTDETIRQLYAQEANLRSGSRSTSSVLSPSSSSSPSLSQATPFSATIQGSSTNTENNKAGNRGSMRKKASDETIASSIAFHNSERACARVNLFEKIPTEVLCVILGWVVEPMGEKMSATDDGDGLRIGNPLLYWHLNPDRTLLRLVCRSWNQTIVAMAREIHVKLGSDESMVKLLETEERRRARPVTLTRTTATQGRIGGARLPHLSLAIRNAYSNSLSRSNIPRPQSPLQRQQPNLLQQQLQQQAPLRRSARLSQVTQHTTSPTTPSSSSLSTPTRTTPRSQATTADWEPSFTYIHTRTTREQNERRRLVKQTAVPIQGFYRLSLPIHPTGTTTGSASGSSSSMCAGGEVSKRVNPWSFPPSVSSLFVEGDLIRSSDPKEDVTLSSSYAGTNPRPGGGSFDATSRSPRYRMNNARFGTMLDHWLRAAAPEGLVKFSVSSSADFGLNGLLSLPRTLTTLKISRCPRINGGALHHGFHHLSNLTSLTLCSELLFTDETFLIALKTLSQLTRFVYVYPCDAVQPVWRDLFRYCSSCELYHRRVTTKTYSRTLMMPELPDQIQDFTFEMDEPRFQESRIETFENNRHGLDRKDIRYAVTLWKADDSTAIPSQTPHWCGFDLAQDEVRSWWPANLTRLDLSKSIVTGSTFDVPPQLQELVIAYPLEPNEMTAIEDDGSGLSIEEKQWYPESLSTLEIRGVPYHVPCVIHDESDTKIRGWMSYINRMLKMVPRQLEHLTTSSFQVPEADSMAAMNERVQNNLKTWKVRLLCPQRPRESGYSMLQLYAPFIYVDDESGEDEDEEVEEDIAVLSSGDDTDSDSSMDYTESFLRRGELVADRLRRRRQQAQRQARPTLGQTRPLGQTTSHQGSQGVQTAMGSLSAAEKYDVTPVMLRQAVKDMKVLESLEVYVNYQHFRLCRANWKGSLGLFEPPLVVALPTPNGNNEENERDGDHVDQGEAHPRKKLKSILKRPTGTASGGSTPAGSSMDRKGKGRAHDDPKGKERKANLSSQHPETSWDGIEGVDVMLEAGRQDKGKGVKRGRDVGDHDLDGQVQSLATITSATGIGGPVRGGGRGAAKTSLRYWENSCCGERCLGWGRVHLD